MKEEEQHNLERLYAVTLFLKWYRINSGYTQEELSHYSGIHRNTIIRYESCNPENLTLLTLFKICDAFEGLNIKQIFLDIE